MTCEMILLTTVRRDNEKFEENPWSYQLEWYTHTSAINAFCLSIYVLLSWFWRLCLSLLNTRLCCQSFYKLSRREILYTLWTFERQKPLKIFFLNFFLNEKKIFYFPTDASITLKCVDGMYIRLVLLKM